MMTFTAIRGATDLRGGTFAVTENTKYQVRPLYLQVRDKLLDRIKEGTWKPGANLPSEINLYRDLGVSLGTLRKALGVLEREQLIVREPGRGTFVRDHQSGQTPSRFNPICGPDGQPIRGEVKVRKVKVAAPGPQERAALRLGADDQVARVQRVRFYEHRPFAFELLCLPERRFPGIAARSDIPDELEELAQAWGVLVARAEAKVRTARATPAVAAALSIAEAETVLTMERLAFDTDDQPVELMTAYFDLHKEYCRLDMR
jgi:GntR family transcriptional regulator